MTKTGGKNRDFPRQPSLLHDHDGLETTKHVPITRAVSVIVTNRGTKKQKKHETLEAYSSRSIQLFLQLYEASYELETYSCFYSSRTGTCTGTRYTPSPHLNFTTVFTTFLLRSFVQVFSRLLQFLRSFYYKFFFVDLL